MSSKHIYANLGYTSLKNASDPSLHDVVDFQRLKVDKVYYSGQYPAIFFKEVESFDPDTLKEIARIQHLIWNYRKVMFLFVSSKTEVRIYNCTLKPFNYDNPNVNITRELEKYELIREGVTALKTITEIFSQTAVDSGTLWNTDNDLKNKISLQNRIDKFLVSSLLNAAKKLKANGLSDEVIHSLLMRSIFIMYLEDKGAAGETSLYSKIDKNANCYFDILESVDATYRLFNKLEVHFNGNVFPIIENEQELISDNDLKVIKNCLFDGDLSGNAKLFNWRLFRFDIIQIELLSEIYEHFLEEFRTDKKEEAGQYYTPPSLVELVLNEKLPTTKTDTNWHVKILDPACGSGIFLVEGYKRLIKRWKNANPGKLIEFSDLKDILVENIYGIEYDKLAIRVTTFSLYLAMVEQLNPSTLWIDNSRKFPYLISDKSDGTIKKQGSNLLRADTVAEIGSGDVPEMQLVVGNPPFGSKTGKHKPTKDFCSKHGFGQDLVIPFLYKAADFAPNGSVALIFNTKVLTNTEGPFQNFRRWLFNDVYVEKVYNLSIFRKALKSFGGQLFSSAVGPVSIAFYQKNKPAKIKNTIEYWAPKTYVKNTLVEGVIIDNSDIKFLPRTECEKPDTKIWKIAMWGSLEDYAFVSELLQLNNLGKFIDDNKLEKGLGLQFLDSSTKKPLPDKDIAKLPYVHPEAISRFFTHSDCFSKPVTGLTEKSKVLYRKHYKLAKDTPVKSIDVFRRLGTKEAYVGPHILVKEGLSNKKLCASFVPHDSTFNSKVLGISGKNKQLLKAMTAFINSDLATYVLFLISASIGIEREEIKPNEIYQIPFNLDAEDIKVLAGYVDDIVKRVNSNHPMFADVSDIEALINKKIFGIFKIAKTQQYLIDDFLTFNADLIFSGHKSSALKPITSAECHNYSSVLTKELQKFLGSSERVSTIGYDVFANQPLSMVKITFGAGKDVKVVKANEEFETQLSTINKYLLKKGGENVYIRRQCKYFDNDSIYFVKPNQKRLWSSSAAINDARELIAEILNMKS